MIIYALYTNVYSTYAHLECKFGPTKDPTESHRIIKQRGPAVSLAEFNEHRVMPNCPGDSLPVDTAAEHAARDRRTSSARNERRPLRERVALTSGSIHQRPPCCFSRRA